MTTVSAVRLRNSAQDYFFDPGDTGVATGDHVVVETSGGQEMGLCTDAARDVSDDAITQPLKPIVRVADEHDLRVAEELGYRGDEALVRFRELAREHGLEMKPIAVNFSFEGKRATFFFSAEHRVDFRALVRELSSEYHVRVDMRMLGDRDVARMLGGFGHCGEELCCVRLPGKFKSVGIRMAKDQDLSLSPDKIAGVCGKLMCCLRYEFDVYKEFKGRAPKKNALIDTPQGKAKVVDFDMPNDSVRLRFADGKMMTVPIKAMDTGGKVAPEGQRVRPCHISQEKFDQIIEELHHDRQFAMMGSRAFSDDSALADKTAEPGAVERNPDAGKRRRGKGGSGELGGGSQGGSGGGSGRKRRRRRGGRGRGGSGSQGGSSSGGSGSGGGSQGGQKQGGSQGQRDQRKARRSVSVATGETKSGSGGSRSGVRSGSGGSKGAAKGGSSGGSGSASKSGGSKGGGPGGGSKSGGSKSGPKGGRPRPGQHSSSVSGTPSE